MLSKWKTVFLTLSAAINKPPANAKTPKITVAPPTQPTNTTSPSPIRQRRFPSKQSPPTFNPLRPHHLPPPTTRPQTMAENQPPNPSIDTTPPQTMAETQPPNPSIDTTPLAPLERQESLERHLQMRPDAQDLKNRNILLDTNAAPYAPLPFSPFLLKR